MIKKECLSGQWIKDKQKEIKIDPILIEKAIFTFELLGSLIENGIYLVFKGGTSLMLLIPEIKRLSIDLDIVTDEDDKTMDRAFNNIVKGEVFRRWQEDKRLSKHEIPVRYFKFFYDSPTGPRESYILLDVIQMNSPFSKTVEKQILSPIFEVENEVKVTIPTVNSLTGDKLSAFAPTSIGIPYGKDKSMEIIKQLFDLGILFEHITDLREISESYKKIAQAEASYCNLSFAPEEFLNDSINTALLICQLDFRGSIENDYTRELRDGIRRIKSHIIGGRYSILDAKEDASKIACLASLIKESRLNINVERLRQDREDIDRIKDFDLPENLSILNKLKAISPKSFYLWAIASKMIK